MATTPEGKVKKAVKELLDRYKAFHWWPVTNGMGVSGVDCVACYRGHMIVIETKAKLGQEPTGRQRLFMRTASQAGAWAVCVAGMEGLLLLEGVLRRIEGRENVRG